MVPRIFVLATTHKGTIDPTVLGHAFRVLCDRHPILRAHIIRDDVGYLLQVPGKECPDLAVRDGGHAQADREMRAPLDPAEGVARLTLIRGDSDPVVVFRATHAIADGRSALAWLDQLWRDYTALATGSTTVPLPSSFVPPAPQTLTAARQATTGIESSPDPAQPPHTGEASDRHSDLRRHVRLTEPQTTYVAAQARAHGLSVHALCCAGVLLAQRALAVPATAALPMVCWSAVDLRDRVERAVTATETTNFLGLHRADLTLDGDVTLFEIARQIKAQLTAALTDGQLAVNPLEGPPLDIDSPFEEHLAQACTTNLRVIPELAQPPHLTISDLEITSFAPTRFPYYRFYTYAGRLTIDFAYPATVFTENDVDTLTTAVISHLTRSAG